MDNYITGKGKFEYATGCFYRGEFVNNVKHGKGIYTWKNLNSYKVNLFDAVYALPRLNSACYIYAGSVCQ